MCGIVGLISQYTNGFNNDEMSIFSDLLFLDTVRGFDSTGVFGVENSGNVYMHKEASNGLAFLQTPEYKQFKMQMFREGKFMVGHNRAATRGSVTDKNAHPFWVDDKIVLVQNGTYKGSHHHLKKTDVDTEAVAHTISDSSTVEEALQKINASYALVWYNAATEELNLIRNSERPLYIAEYGVSGIAWASEDTFLKFAFERAKVEFSKPPVMVPEHTLITFKLNNKGSYFRTDTALNAAYVHPKSEYGDYTDYMGRYSHYVSPNHVPQVPRLVGPNSPNDIRHVFVDQINRTRRDYWFATQEEANKAINIVKDAQYNGHNYVEMVDYFPANDHPQCNTWHVYGTVVGVEVDDKGPAFLVHWLQYDKTEAEILDMVYGSFYKCKLSTNVMRSVTSNQKQGWLVTAYASEHSAMEGLTV